MKKEHFTYKNKGMYYYNCVLDSESYKEYLYVEYYSMQGDNAFKRFAIQ